MSGKNEMQNAPLMSWYALGIMVLVYMIGLTDRQILAILITPVQQDLDLTDVQIGLLQGFAFALLFCTMGLVAGWAVDRFDRRIVTMISVIFWSISCGLCGAANGFWGLFAARVGVGIGEGTMTPGGYSLISDLFPKRQLSLALSIYTMGANLGMGLSFILGGAISAMAVQYGPIVLPLLGDVKAWQFTFILLAAIGLVIAPLMATFREPQRRNAAPIEPGFFKPLIASIREKPAAYSSLLIAFPISNAIGMALLSWGPAFLMRHHNWTQAKAGLTLGLLVALAGITGPLVHGLLASRLEAKGYVDAHLKIPFISSFAIIALGIVSLLMLDSSVVWLACMAGIYFITSGNVVCGSSALQIITPNRLRGRMVAIYGATSTIIGGGFGPLVVAYVTEHVLGSQKLVGTSLGIVIALFAVPQLLLLARGLQGYRQALGSMNQEPVAV
jgi:MFS family permease